MRTDLVCATCANGGIPVRRLNIAGQVFLGVGALVVLGAFGVNPAGGVLGAVCAAIAAWWFLRDFGTEIRCAKCGALAVERAAAIHGAEIQIREERARLQKEQATKREDETAKDKFRDDLAGVVENELGDRVMWVRRGSCNDDDCALSIVTELPARQLEQVLVARGIIRRAREVGYDAVVIHGSMSKKEYGRLEDALIDAYQRKDDEAEGELDRQIDAMQERDLLAIQL